MGVYVGDRARRTLHSSGALRATCMDGGVDVRDILDVHSQDFADYLLQSERWTPCPRCLPGGR